MKEALPASAAAKAIEIWFQDEARVGQQNNPARRLELQNLRQRYEQLQRAGPVNSQAFSELVRDLRSLDAQLPALRNVPELPLRKARKLFLKGHVGWHSAGIAPE